MSRAFALPVVLMVALTTTLIAATMIDRYATSRLAIQRQLDGYRDYHAEAGLPELIISYWKDIALDRREMLEILDEADGPVLTVTARGERVRIWVRPGQGTLPVGPAALGSDVLARAERLLDRSHPGREDLRRRAGPEQVSAVDAQAPVLEALAEAAIDDASLAKRWASEIISTANRGELDSAADIRQAANDAGLDDQQRQAIESLVTIRPTLWSVMVEVQTDNPPPGQSGVRRYSALLLERDASANDRSWFVDWHTIDEDAPGQDTVWSRRLQERTGR